MLAGRKNAHPELRVRVVRRNDRHEIDVVPREQLVGIR